MHCGGAEHGHVEFVRINLGLDQIWERLRNTNQVRYATVYGILREDEC